MTSKSGMLGDMHPRGLTLPKPCMSSVLIPEPTEVKPIKGPSATGLMDSAAFQE